MTSDNYSISLCVWVCVNRRFLKSIPVSGLEHLMDYLSGDPRGHRTGSSASSNSPLSHFLLVFLHFFILPYLTSHSSASQSNESATRIPNSACKVLIFNQAMPWRAARIHQVTCEGEMRMGVNRGDGSIIAYFKLFLHRVRYKCVDGLDSGVGIFLEYALVASLYNSEVTECVCRRE